MGSVLASDISGSSLTIAYQNYEQDAATRKFLVSADDRGEAITTVTTALVQVYHPDEANLFANQITAQSVGSDRWIVTVQYVRKRWSPAGSQSNPVYNVRISYEAVEVFCTPDLYQDGLPFGGNGEDFVNPGGPAGQNTDPNDPPKPWVCNLPVLSIQVPFSTTTNPISALTNNVGDIGNLTTPSIQGVRFDGSEVKAVRPSAGGTTRYYGVENYTYRRGGWVKQVLKWDTSAGIESGKWVAENISVLGGAG